MRGRQLLPFRLHDVAYRVRCLGRSNLLLLSPPNALIFRTRSALWSASYVHSFTERRLASAASSGTRLCWRGRCLHLPFDVGADGPYGGQPAANIERPVVPALLETVAPRSGPAVARAELGVGFEQTPMSMRA
jgi:hypothetical protein